MFTFLTGMLLLPLHISTCRWSHPIWWKTLIQLDAAYSLLVYFAAEILCLKESIMLRFKEPKNQIRKLADMKKVWRGRGEHIKKRGGGEPKLSTFRAGNFLLETSLGHAERRFRIPLKKFSIMSWSKSTRSRSIDKYFEGWFLIR